MEEQFGLISLLMKKEIAFVGTGNPRPALVGLNRQGKNKNANSIIAIDLKIENYCGHIKM